jgi:hypothetical protein
MGWNELGKTFVVELDVFGVETRNHGRVNRLDLRGCHGGVQE